MPAGRPDRPRRRPLKRRHRHAPLRGRHGEVLRLPQRLGDGRPRRKRLQAAGWGLDRRTLSDQDALRKNTLRERECRGRSPRHSICHSRSAAASCMETAVDGGITESRCIRI